MKNWGSCSRFALLWLCSFVFPRSLSCLACGRSSWTFFPSRERAIQGQGEAKTIVTRPPLVRINKERKAIIGGKDQIEGSINGNNRPPKKRNGGKPPYSFSMGRFLESIFFGPSFFLPFYLSFFSLGVHATPVRDSSPDGANAQALGEMRSIAF